MDYLNLEAQKTYGFYKAHRLLDSILFSLKCFKDFAEISVDPVLPIDFILANEYLSQFPQHAIPIIEPGENKESLLSPTCCYPLFHHLENSILEVKSGFSTKSYVYRKEQKYIKWKRQKTFLLREFILLGKEDDITAWIEHVKEEIIEVISDLDLSVNLGIASDPFFNINSFQSKVQSNYELKTEFVINELAVSSLNFHLNSFGKKCNIMMDSDYVYSGCFGLGYTRIWDALVEEHGPVKSINLLENLAKLSEVI